MANQIITEIEKDLVTAYSDLKPEIVKVALDDVEAFITSNPAASQADVTAFAVSEAKAVIAKLSNGSKLANLVGALATPAITAAVAAIYAKVKAADVAADNAEAPASNENNAGN